MLIVLRKEEYPRDDVQRAAWRASPEFGAFLDHLADALKWRSHAVEAPSKLLEWLARCEGLSDLQRGALGEASIVNQQRELPFTEASHALLLTGPLGASADPKGVRTTWIRRDWRWLARRGEPLRKAALVAENMDDSKLFVWAGRAMGARLMQSEVNAGDEVALDCIGGGGSTTGPVYESQVRQGSPTLCVVDADKSHSTGVVGKTAQAVHDAEKSLSITQEVPPHAVVMLDAYTIENVLPIDLVRLSCPSAAWVEPMARRGFFLQRKALSAGGPLCPPVDPLIKYINPVEATAAMLRDCVGKDMKLPEVREDMIQRIRELDPSAPKADEAPLVLSVGKLPKALVEKLEELRDRKKRPLGYPSAAHWLCSQLRKSPDAFADEWEPVARAVWSWGLRFPQTIRERPPAS